MLSPQDGVELRGSAGLVEVKSEEAVLIGIVHPILQCLIIYKPMRRSGIGHVHLDGHQTFPFVLMYQPLYR
jgi:hypothetical protein